MNKLSLAQQQASDALIRPSRGKRLHQEAVDVLRAWSRWSNDYGEVCQATGKSNQSWLGKMVDKANKKSKTRDSAIGFIGYTDSEMDHVDRVIKSLSSVDQQIIHWQYVVVLPVHAKLERLDVPKHTYYRRLNAAHDIFIANSGISA